MSATTTTKTLYFATADEYLCALWIQADMWANGNATYEPYRLVATER